MTRNERPLARLAAKRGVSRIHFVGIGGAGMSGIAEVMLNLGFQVSGSDLRRSATTERLEHLGARIFIGHAATNIEQADVLVVSSAVREDNPELRAAHAKHLPVLPRAEMLAELMRFQQGIAVCGTHGKTTTTSLIAAILAEAGCDPTFVIGGLLNQAGTHARLGQGHYLVAEADESDASFLHLQPLVTVVTNVEPEHMDTYQGDFSQLEGTFVEFLRNLPFYGLAVVCADDEVARRLPEQAARKFVTYGFAADADYRVVAWQQTSTRVSFTLNLPDGTTHDFDLGLPGRHNVQNAAAAVAVALEEGLDVTVVQQALKHFKGIGRRFQDWGERSLASHQVRVIDDYGHHPTEVAATIAAARAAFPERRLVMLFQPHRYTRTRDLYEDFVQVLAEPDVLLMLDVYAAGEDPIVGADTKSLCRSIRLSSQKEPVYVAEPEQLVDILRRHLLDGDVLITQGAGNVGQICQRLIAQSKTGGEKP